MRNGTAGDRAHDLAFSRDTPKELSLIHIMKPNNEDIAEDISFEVDGKPEWEYICFEVDPDPLSNPFRRRYP